MRRNVWITGGSGGIGAAIARRFAADGYGVLIQYHHNEKAANALVAELIAQGADVACVQADVTQPFDMKKAAEFAEYRFGHIDVLVHSAGIADIKLFTDTSYEDWQRMMCIHLDGAYHACQAVLPGMISRQEGNIILVTSMWGQVGASCEVAYSTAKAGLIGMTKALAKELGPSGIRVNGIAPGVIDTPMNGTLDQPALDALVDEIPLGRIGAVEEMAGVAAFLVSSDAAYITGQVIAPNGGMVI